MAKPGVPAPLRPFVRAWLWSKTSDGLAVPRPTDDPDQRLAGPAPFEVVLVGAGAASSWGVLSHSLGLSGALARTLRAATQRGVVIRCRIDPALTAVTAVDAVTSARTRFDTLRVVVLGVNEALDMLSPSQWRSDIERVLAALQPTTEHPAVVAGIQPISSIPLYAGGLSYWLDRQVTAMNEETVAACAATPHAAFAALSSPPVANFARYRGPADYHFWANQLTAAAVTVLPPRVTSTASARDPAIESRRHDDLERLGIHDLGDRFEIDDVVQGATKIFGTQSAGLMVLEDDRAWFYSGFGTDRTEVNREGSFTSFAMEARDDFIVNDASQDDRFRNNAHVVGPPHVRFYAGRPIDGPSGHRIGVLCIFDPEPREFEEASRELLRNLAMRIQIRLQRGTR